MCWFCKVILVWVFKVDPNRNKTRGRDVPQETDVTVSCEVIKKKKKRLTPLRNGVFPAMSVNKDVTVISDCSLSM